MADPVPPAARSAAARTVGEGRALVVIERKSEPAGEPRDDAATSGSARGHKAQVSAVGAQLLGEKPRRGLRAGPEVLDQARFTYLQNEYSGARDRRPRKGQLTRTEI